MSRIKKIVCTILTAILFSTAAGVSQVVARGASTSENRTKIERGINSGATKINPATKQTSAEKRFKGSVAQSRFEMTLRRDGERLDGSYFYVKSGGANPLKLSGKID
ncbi:MAG TPA: hypothetical protein VF692_06475, partial [Pyrinomonadaceae bacterium]